MIGTTFSRLTVVALAYKDASYNKYWSCNCSCGMTSIVRSDKLISGKIKSCGCLFAERVVELQAKATEEDRKYTKSSYSSMVQRCTNSMNASYKDYGGKGILVCNRWLNGDGQLNGWTLFFMDMGTRPRGTSIDRIDNSKGYFPENCRWATPFQQVVNRSATKLTANDVLEIRQRNESGSKAAEMYGVSKDHVKKLRQGKGWTSITEDPPVNESGKSA